MSFLKKQVSRAGTQSLRYVFNFHIVQVSSMPEVRGPVFIEITRHSKSVTSKKVLCTMDRRAVWDETLSLPLTLYQEGHKSSFQEKNVKVYLKDTNKTLGSTKINISSFAVSKDQTVELEFEEFAKKPKPHPLLKLTISSVSPSEAKGSARRQSQMTEASYVTDITAQAESEGFHETEEAASVEDHETLDESERYGHTTYTHSESATRTHAEDDPNYDPLLGEKYDALLQKHEVALANLDTLQKQLLELKRSSTGTPTGQAERFTEEIRSLNEKLAEADKRQTEQENDATLIKKDLNTKLDNERAENDRLTSIVSQSIEYLNESKLLSKVYETTPENLDSAVSAFIDGATKEIARLTSESKHYQQRLIELQTSESSKSEEVAVDLSKYEIEISTLREKNVSLQFELQQAATVTKERNELKLRVSALSSQLSSLQSKLENAERNVETNESDLKKKQSRIDELDLKLGSQTHEMKTLEKTISDLEHKLSLARNEIEHLKSETQSRNLASETETEKRLRDLSETNKQLQQKCTTLEHTLETTRKEFQGIIDDMKEELKEEAKENEDLDEQVTVCSSYIQELEEKLQAFDTKLSDSESKKIDLEQQNEELREQLKKMTEANEALAKSNQRKDNQIHELEETANSLTSAGKEVGVVEKKFIEAQGENQRLKKEKEANLQELSTLRKLVENYEKDTEKSNTQAQRFEKAISDLTEKIEKLQESESVKQEELDRTNARVSELELENRELERLRDKYHQELSLSKPHISTLKVRCGQLEAELERIEKSYKDKLQVLEEQQAKDQETIKGLQEVSESKKKDTEGEVERLEQELIRARIGWAESEAEKDQILKQMHDLRTSVTNHRQTPTKK